MNRDEKILEALLVANTLALNALTFSEKVQAKLKQLHDEEREATDDEIAEIRAETDALSDQVDQQLAAAKAKFSQ